MEYKVIDYRLSIIDYQFFHYLPQYIWKFLDTVLWDQNQKF